MSRINDRRKNKTFTKEETEILEAVVRRTGARKITVLPNFRCSWWCPPPLGIMVEYALHDVFKDDILLHPPCVLGAAEIKLEGQWRTFNQSELRDRLENAIPIVSARPPGLKSLPLSGSWSEALSGDGAWIGLFHTTTREKDAHRDRWVLCVRSTLPEEYLQELRKHNASLAETGKVNWGQVYMEDGNVNPRAEKLTRENARRLVCRAAEALGASFVRAQGQRFLEEKYDVPPYSEGLGDKSAEVVKAALASWPAKCVPMTPAWPLEAGAIMATMQKKSSPTVFEAFLKKENVLWRDSPMTCDALDLETVFNVPAPILGDLVRFGVDCAIPQQSAGFMVSRAPGIGPLVINPGFLEHDWDTVRGLVSADASVWSSGDPLGTSWAFKWTGEFAQEPGPEFLGDRSHFAGRYSGDDSAPVGAVELIPKIVVLGPRPPLDPERVPIAKGAI